MTIHLTHTGVLAGQPFCGAVRDEEAQLSGEVQYAHGVYAPIERAEYRAHCCPACLAVFASAWDEDQEKPHWVFAVLNHHATHREDPRQQELFA